MKRKMNGLYKAAFVLLLAGIILFIAAVVTAYAVGKRNFSVVFSCGGSALVLLGIIFAGFSKPKRRKRHAAEYDESENGIEAHSDYPTDSIDEDLFPKNSKFPLTSAEESDKIVVDKRE